MEIIFFYSLRNFHFIEIITSACSKYFFTLLSLNFSWLRHTCSYIGFAYIISLVSAKNHVYIPKGTKK